jgi:hypothetical protein
LTVEQVKAYCRNEIPTDDDEWIEAAADAAEATLDHACQRRFQVASGTSARVFVPSDSEVVRIHDAVSITSVSNNGSTVSLADYQLEPLNGLSQEGEARPYEQIRLTSGLWYIDQHRATITVTASWGWTAIPARIEQAALIIAKEIIVNRDEVKLGLIGFSDVGGVTARTNPIVRATIEQYRRVEAFGIA